MPFIILLLLLMSASCTNNAVSNTDNSSAYKSNNDVLYDDALSNEEIHKTFIPAVYTLDDLEVTNRNKVAGGNGDLIVKYAFVRDNAPKDYTTKEMGYMTLMPGDSVGLHKHEDNEDSYLIVSGIGTYTDTDGSQYEVKSGDMTICRSGHSHAISNSGKSPLIFFAVLSGK
ncbi:cupin domain-containing protein [uncultured Brachyspira sp.]|nr:cupin domain-containing protein [uncultured Brachyspira sp.]